MKLTPADRLVIDNLPPYMQDSLKSYIIFGREPTGFMRAVICNDLFTAIATATVEDMENIGKLLNVMQNEFPNNSFGTEAKMDRFLQNHPYSNKSFPA